ncbi:MAG: filamentous hemagglutinin family N-terminal domain protein [Nevskia sp.]|nr:filamentous hemagglutinin family N-terminal domain protein [Nevskia sp.]
MNGRNEVFRLSADGRLRRLAMLSALGICSLAPIGLAGTAQAGAPPAFGSPAWLAQKGTQQPVNPAAPSSGVPGAITTPQQAKTQAQQSLADLSKALATISAAQSLQKSAAGQISVSDPHIPDGVGAGGLQRDINGDWIGADGALKSSASANGQVEVTVTQNQQRAILDWSSFNISKNTTLDFDQSAGTQTDGTNNWVALNRVNGPATQIMGSIKAQGDVYIIDPNGILFGAGSKVDTHSLIASTLNFLSTDRATADSKFLASGLSNAGAPPDPTMGGLLTHGDSAAGSITIESGASITTGELGFSLIAAPHIENHGSITATDGQIILAAGSGVSLSQSANSAGLIAPTLAYDPAHPESTLVNDGIIQSLRGNVTLLGLDIRQDGIVGATTSVTRPGSITINASVTTDPNNPVSGSVDFGSASLTTILPSEDGEITTSSSAASAAFKAPSASITGGAVTFESGSLLDAPGATVSVNAVLNGTYTSSVEPGQAGRIFIDGCIPVGCTTGAVIDVAGMPDVILPVSDTMVTIGPLTANDLADSPLLRDGFLFSQTVTVDSTLAGTRADGTPWVGSPLINASGYIEAVPRGIDQLLVNGGKINLSGHQVIAKTGSVLDLDGGYVNYQGGMVAGQTLLQGADGRLYSIGNADPNIEYVGFAGSYSTTYARWNRTDTWVDPLLSGSLSRYEPGFIQGGNAGTLTVVVNAAQSSGTHIDEGTAILDGTITAQAMAGRNQVSSGSQPEGGTFNIGASVALGTTSFSPSYFITDQNLVLLDGFNAGTSLADAFPGLTGGVDPTQVPNGADPNTAVFDLTNWTPVNGAALAAGGFSSINITSPQGQIVVSSGATLSVKPYINGDQTSNIALNAASITVDGTLTAHAGTISLVSNGLTTGPTFGYDSTSTDAPQSGNIVIGKGALLDASGQWVNDTGLGPEQIGGKEFINGGSIVVETQQESLAVPNGQGGTTIVDTTGSIAIDGTLDVSSGGYIDPTGQVLAVGGVPQGSAGRIDLAVYAISSNGSFGPSGANIPLPDAPPSGGTISLGESGQLIGYGFSEGGTLELQALGILIGQDGKRPDEARSWDLYLPASFFSGQGGFDQGKVEGFGNYVLNAEYDATVMPGTQISLKQQNLLPDYAALASVATGGITRDLLGKGILGVGTLDDYHRSATDLTITAGDYFSWSSPNADAAGPPSSIPASVATGTLLVGEGAAINGDNGAHILLGSPGQVAVLGSITAHGGSIALDGLRASDIERGQLTDPADAASSASFIPGQSVVLGDHAVLDVSGVAVVDPYIDQPPATSGQVAPPVSGKVLDGGSVSIYSGTIVAARQPDAAGQAQNPAAGCADAGAACIDVSGAGAERQYIFDLPQQDGSYAPQQVWSDAGQVTLAASSGLYFDGVLRSAGGSGETPGHAGQGGTLNLITLGSASGLILRPSGDTLPQDYQWTPGSALPTDQNGTLLFSVDTLKNSGIASLAVGSDATPGSNAPETFSNLAPITLGFAGDVTLNLGLSFTADAMNYVALADGATTLGDLAATPTAVSITAPYVALDGFYRTSNLLSGGMALPASDPLPLSSLDIQASFIDLGGAFTLENFTNAGFTSTPNSAGLGGDIRFVTPAQFDFVGDHGNGASITPQRGALLTAGDLTFTGRELYPASGNSFVVEAGTPGNDRTIVIASTGGAAEVPLSAGGSLLLDAAFITQDGTLWAPAGSIVLGVGDPKDAATVALFNPADSILGSTLNSLALVQTQSVSLGSDSTTSVSLGGAVLPYGTTLDGKEWQYNSNPGLGGNASQPDLTAPPAKLIQVEGASITVDPKATVDLSGGGQLQATEWVPGTGGTRDVLSQFNLSYATSPSGTQVPLYPDQRGIYALVPADHATMAVAPYDPVFAQGQAAIGVGQAIQISGAPGIPAGSYVLMPAKYATLPGAFRVVQDTAAVDSVAGGNNLAPDGTLFVEGKYVNALNGAQDARTTTFEIQSAATWGQYSDYTRTSADTFFPALAALNGNAAPQLPRDAGQLILGATSSLDLGKGFSPDTAAASGGVQASIDIASQNIQVVASDAQAQLDGYVVLTVDQLNGLNAGSLLLGGTHSQSSSGTSISAVASNIVVDDAPVDGSGKLQAATLQAPEVLLVAKTSTDGMGNVTEGSIRVVAGSKIAAVGNVAAGADKPISIDGGGAFLMVSNGQPVVLTRPTGAGVAGLLDIEANANISGGNSLILDSTGDTRVDGSAVFTGANITADAGSIVFFTGSQPQPNAAGLLIGDQTLGQFQEADSITLRSYQGIDFEGDVKVTVNGTLALSAGGFTNGGGTVSLTAGTLILGNDLATSQPTAAAPSSGELLLSATNKIEFGSAGGAAGNTVVFSGFGDVQASAAAGIVGQSNIFDFGSVNVTLSAPIVFAATNSNAVLRTTGALNLVTPAAGAAGTPLSADDQLGGQLELDGGSIDIGGKLQATAGNLILDAKSQNLTIEGSGMLSVAGVGKQFFDVYRYAPGGSISLTAENGSVLVDSGATLDFSGARPVSGTQGGGSNAGALIIDSSQAPVIAGVLNGSAPAGFIGGSFSLDTGAAFKDLDSLVAALPSSNDNPLALVSIHTGQGDIELVDHSIYANSVELVADGGTVRIDSGGSIHADGLTNGVGDSSPNPQAGDPASFTQGPGGSIALYGTQGVDVEGTLSAATANPYQRGGTVQIGTSGTPNPAGSVSPLNNQYGYENIDPGNSGTITIGAGATIDVSGGSANGHDGGIVSLRAPLLSNGDVNVQIADDAKICTGSICPKTGMPPTGGVFSLEAYAVWSTDDAPSPGVPPGADSRHFDGVIDPAGWFDSSGHLVSGTFTDQDGHVVLNYDANTAPMTDQELATLLATDLFTPATANSAHQSFYGYVDGDPSKGAGTLMAFVENPGFSSALQNHLTASGSHDALTVAPGIELDNPDKSINSGNIVVASNWNLGACNPCSGTNATFLYRYQNQAPVLTVRAENNLEINASLSDGFSQLVAGPELSYSAAAATAAGTGFNTISGDGKFFLSTIKVSGQAGYPIGTDPNFAPLQTPPAGQPATYYNNYNSYYVGSVGTWSTLASRTSNTNYTVSPKNVAPGAPVLQGQDFATYATAYNTYLTNLTASGGTPQPPTLPADPKLYGTPSGGTALSYMKLWLAYDTKVKTLEGTISPFGSISTLRYYIYPPQPPAASTASVQAAIADGNAPANVRSTQNVAPLAYATLVGGSSTSYRLVAGAADGADPLSVRPVSGFGADEGSVLVGGYSLAKDELSVFGTLAGSQSGNSPVLAFPTVVRTGTGSIDIAAGNDFSLNPTTAQDSGAANAGAVAPGVVYTAGAPDGMQNGSVDILRLGSSGILPELIVTGTVNPQGAGDLSIRAQNDIVGGLESLVDSDGSRTGTAGQFVGQLWSPWLETGNTPNASSINFGNFDQGVLSSGGNVSINAGRDITDLSVSLPTTWTLAPGDSTWTTFGGGNLQVSAGGDILSGAYFVARGQGSIQAGAGIGVSDDAADFTYLLPTGSASKPNTIFQDAAPPLLALQDAQVRVQARQGVDIGGVYDPSYLAYRGIVGAPDSQPYSQDSSLTLSATAGEVRFDSFSLAALVLWNNSVNVNTGTVVLPATLDITALDGGISVQNSGELFPSPLGELSLVADQSISFVDGDAFAGKAYFGMIDAAPASMPSPLMPLNPIEGGLDLLPFGLTLASASSTTGDNHSAYTQHQAGEPLHAGDPQPVRIYSLEGSIVNGQLTQGGFYADYLRLVTDKPTLIQAGQDIVNLDFVGQNLSDSDVTRIKAGRDIYDTPVTGDTSLSSPNEEAVSLQLAGPGYFDIEAGRNIGPLTNQIQAVTYGYFGSSDPSNITGIDTVGNLYNPYLTHQGASVSVLFGIGPGIDAQDFIARYIAPGVSVSGVPSYAAALLSFVEQYEAGLLQVWDSGRLKDRQTVTLTADQAWTKFQSLPGYVQQIFVEQVFNDILFRTGQDFHNPASPNFQQYARGYDAINTLFPASLGYTANSLNGGTNGSSAPVSTGDMDVRGSTIQTQQGGDISILGPGGNILLASASAPPFLVDGNGKTLAGPNTEGVLTLQQGNINIFTDGSMLLAQSRVFTEEGGNLLIWSSNGDINAGQGTKTTAFVPPLQYTCDLDHFCSVEPAGEVTGAGIATLQTTPGAPPGDVELVAPRGTVDAGAAGIRVSGNLVIAALAVANAFNIQVKGTSVGVPVVARVDTGALSAASSAAAAATDASALSNRPGPDAGSQISVEVVGFGTPDEEQKKRMRQKKKSEMN